MDLNKLGPEKRMDYIKSEFALLLPSVGLCAAIKKSLDEVPQFKKVFGDNIFDYKKMDFTFHQFPSIRIWSERFRRDGESWFIVGDILVDVMLPALIRRSETQTVQDIIAAALLAQFTRSKTIFPQLKKMVPGLNQLGNTFDCDKSLGFEFDNGLVPLTRLTLGFKIDLREFYDHFMEGDYRTKEEPFERTLGDLERISAVIQAMKDEAEIELEMGIQVTNKGDSP